MDADLTWGGSLQVSSSGDLLLASGTDYSNQRVIRRLFTGPAIISTGGQVIQNGDYALHPNYGAGLGRDVDSVISPGSVRQRETKIKKALAQEAIVDSSQPVKINIKSYQQVQLIQVGYFTIDREYTQFSAEV